MGHFASVAGGNHAKVGTEIAVTAVEVAGVAAVAVAIAGADQRGAAGSRLRRRHTWPGSGCLQPPQRWSARAQIDGRQPLVCRQVSLSQQQIRMYGLVNRAIQQMVCTEHGESVWDEVKRRADLGDLDFFATYEAYPDDVTHRLVAAVSEVLNLPAKAVMQAFGTFWIT